MRPPRFSFAHAARSLARSRGMFIVSVLTLGIGLAAAVALLGVIDGGTRSLPVPGGRNVVELEVRDSHAKQVLPPPPALWARGPGVVEAGALSQTQASLTTDGAPAILAAGAAMQASVFHLLEVTPALGRVPSDEPGDAQALVIGWDIYEQLGATPSVLGRRIDVDGSPHVVVGVMPRTFGFPEKQSFWTLLPDSASGEIVARLANGNREDIGALAAARINAVDAATMQATGDAHVIVQPWTRSRNSGGEGSVFAGLGVLVALLLVVCASNVAILLLVRANERATPLAIHAALGASRGEVAIQLFVEALVIAMVGGMIGLAGGFAMLHWMQSHLSQHWGYYWMKMEVRWPVVASTVGVVLGSAVVAGVAPAWRAARIDLARTLVGAGRGSHDRRQRNLGRWFVGAQVAFSTVGLVAAAYLAWGAMQFGRITSLLPMDEIAIALLTLPKDRYGDASARGTLAASLQQELRRIPGAKTVSVAGTAPGGGGTSYVLRLPGVDTGATGTQRVGTITADAELPATYDMKIVAGRNFTASEIQGEHPAVIVTPSFVRRHLKGAPIGQLVRLEGIHAKGEWAEIVGVANDWFPDRGDASSDRVMLPLAAVPGNELYVAIRTRGDAHSVLGGIRPAVSRVDNDIPVSDVQTLHERMNWFLRMTRVIAWFGVLGGLGSACVAATGLYGVMSFQVRSRIREIGVRMAIGAGAARVLGDVVRESVIRVLPGVAVGMAFATLMVGPLSRFASAGTRPPSVVMLGGVAVAMVLVGVGAALEPAVRAARLSPQVVLRGD